MGKMQVRRAVAAWFLLHKECLLLLPPMSDTPDPNSAPQAPLPPPQPVPDASAMTAEEKQMGMFCHLSSLAGYAVPFGHVLGPLILWLIKKDTMPFVNSEGKESLNFQISVTIYLIASLILSFFCIGFILLIALAVFNLVVVILACIESSKGRPYRYPLCIRLIE